MEIRFHDNFFKDLDKLSLKDVQIFEKKKAKIMEKLDKNGKGTFKRNIEANKIKQRRI